MTARIFRQMTTVICLFCVMMTGFLPAQGPSRRYRPAPQYVQIGKLDQEQGKKILQEFRKNGLYAGECYFEFELRVMPRRGAERIVPGRVWSSHNERGPITRIVIAPGVVAQERRLLVQAGPESAAWGWRLGDTTEPVALSTGALFDRLADTDVTVFDLQMSFLYWDDFVFEGVSKIRGRPAHTFLMYPPPDVVAQQPDLTGIRVYLDTQFHQPVQAERLGPEGKLLKTITVMDLKKIDEQWIVKSIDFRDEATRDKSRFSVTGAAVGLDLSTGLFEPAMLKELIHPPPIERIQKIGP